MTRLLRLFPDPGALAVAGIFGFVLMGAPIWVPWLINLAEFWPW